MVVYALAAIIDLIFLIGIYTERVRIAFVIAILQSIFAGYRIFGLLLGTSGFIITGMTVALAILSILYWIDLKRMATSV